MPPRAARRTCEADEALAPQGMPATSRTVSKKAGRGGSTRRADPEDLRGHSGDDMKHTPTPCFAAARRRIRRSSGARRRLA
ncbi:hypothetical protein DR62_06305 [Burkholderia thailandensis]|nr:hypothetical protein DR62_06305 [Burkholderia thailandensis]AOI52781.1 hypothetical protein WI24_13885 [Burkholderia thailandensis]AOJ51776.1 hypothetical protein AQ475_13775 [Burkholderia thailandensis]AVR24117.1 hypothetical protein A8H32_02340 [Burkholderia thailandensis]MDD1482807.1 hypothetical protein [Burkholderia thailandensis]